jgi:hypothetical protein
VFWFSLQLLPETFLTLRINERDMIKNVYWSSRKVLVILVRFPCNLNFLNRFSKKHSNIKFHENLPGGCRVVPCGRTDMMKPIVAFRNFANMPKNLKHAAGQRTKKVKSCDVSGFRRGAVNILALLGCYAAYVGKWRRFGMIHRSHLQGSSSLLQLFKTRSMLSRNVCNQLPTRVV